MFVHKVADPQWISDFTFFCWASILINGSVVIWAESSFIHSFHESDPVKNKQKTKKSDKLGKQQNHILNEKTGKQPMEIKCQTFRH